MHERIIYAHKCAKFLSDIGIDSLHQDYKEDSLATKAANEIRYKAKFLITVDKEVSFKGKNNTDYKVMLVTARGPNLKSSKKDKTYFLDKNGRDFTISQSSTNGKTRVEVCLKQNYYNQLLAAKKQNAAAIVLTLLSIGYYAGDDKKIKKEMLGYSMKAINEAVAEFRNDESKIKKSSSEMKIDYTFDPQTGERTQGSLGDSLGLATELIKGGFKNVAVSIAGADNSAGGKTIEAKGKYRSTGELPKTQEENVKCRTDWDNSSYRQNTTIIRVNEAAPRNRAGTSAGFWGSKGGAAYHGGSGSYRPSF